MKLRVTIDEDLCPELVKHLLSLPERKRNKKLIALANRAFLNWAFLENVSSSGGLELVGIKDSSRRKGRSSAKPASEKVSRSDGDSLGSPKTKISVDKRPINGSIDCTFSSENNGGEKTEPLTDVPQTTPGAVLDAAEVEENSGSKTIVATVEQTVAALSGNASGGAETSGLGIDVTHGETVNDMPLPRRRRVG